MNTGARIAALAEAARGFPCLGPVTEASLSELLRVELGHPDILDDFQLRGAHWAKAVGPGTILHVISGNTPAAGLQSLLRGVLLGAWNLCKIPRAGLPEIAAFRAALPAELARRIEISPDLPADWLERAAAVIVFGSDSTIAHFRSLLRPGQIFVPHGHRVSVGLIWEDGQFASVEAAARDASLFDQQGCLSPQVFYVEGPARAYAERLAGAMAQFHLQDPRGPVELSEALAIRAARETLAFRAANGEDAALWQSAHSTAWTVAFDATAGFPSSPLNRFIFVKPWPADLAAELRTVGAHLSAAGLWPADAARVRALSKLGFSRFCPIGQMQTPPLTWHQDGSASLAALVKWVDFEPGAAG